jgi:hypothetical protein
MYALTKVLCTLVGMERRTIAATYYLGSVEHGTAATWYIDVPSIGRGRVIAALAGGALHRENAIEVVRELVVTSQGWEPDSFDVELEPAFKLTPQE